LVKIIGEATAVNEITGYAVAVAGVATTSLLAAQGALDVIAQLWSGMADLPFDIVVPFGR
jgi:hypothetical protein